MSSTVAAGHRSIGRPPVVYLIASMLKAQEQRRSSGHGIVPIPAPLGTAFGFEVPGQLERLVEAGPQSSALPLEQ